MQCSIDHRLFGEDDIAGSIALAINDLAEECTYDEMTIMQICKAANVSRTTFYRHFEGKLEAVSWIMRRVSSVGISNIGRTMGWNEGFTWTLLATKHLGNIFKAGGGWAEINKSKLASDFVAYHEGVYFDTIAKVKRERFDEGLELVVKFWLYSLSDALSYWRMNDFTIPVEEMALYLERSVPPEIHRLLKDPGLLPC